MMKLTPRGKVARHRLRKEIVRVVLAHEVFPTNMMLAEIVGMSQAYTHYLLKQAQDAGFVWVDHVPGGRIVTLPSGRKSATPSGNAVHSGGRKRKEVEPVQEQAA